MTAVENAQSLVDYANESLSTSYTNLTDILTHELDVPEQPAVTHIPTAPLGERIKSLVDYANDICESKYSNLTDVVLKELKGQRSYSVEEKEPYLLRKSGGSAIIGTREHDKIVGGTIVWNQLVNTGSTSVTVPSGHKYLSKVNNVQTIGASTGSAISINDASADNVFDLTQMFGSTIADAIYALEQTTAGAGVAWFRNLFPKPYYAYNAGELLSVTGLQSHDMVGFNLWDEEWEVGSINKDTGAPSSHENSIRSKNYCGILPSAAICLCKIHAQACNIYYYDAGFNYISRNATGVANLKSLYTTPANARYFKIASGSNDSPTKTYTGNELCINYSDPSRNGTYEPYHKHSYALDSSITLRGVPKLNSNNRLYFDGDTYEADGTLTSKYGIREYQSGDESITDAITDGTNTVYKLNTPATETTTPYATPQFVHAEGTEEYICETNADVIIPVGHDTMYSTE